MQHYITGYHACRMLAASTDIAAVIGKGVQEKHSPDQISAEAYQSIWGSRNRGQRDFQVPRTQFYFHVHQSTYQ